jgi:OsmC subfamily peroxiredoxin
MKINRSSSAVWAGGLKDGKGAITTQSGALTDYPFGFSSRFEGIAGSNPEELIAAAHAACFTMALSLILRRGRVKGGADGGQGSRLMAPTSAMSATAGLSQGSC